MTYHFLHYTAGYNDIEVTEREDGGFDVTWWYGQGRSSRSSYPIDRWTFLKCTDPRNRIWRRNPAFHTALDVEVGL